MQSLITLIKPFLFIAAQRAGPQILPKSEFLLALVVVLHIVVYFLAMIALDATRERTLTMPLLDTVSEAAFFSVLLLVMGFRERLVQTLTAIFGVNVLLNLVSVPLTLLGKTQPPEMNFAVFLSLFLLLWLLAVKANILKQAAGLPYFAGFLIAVAFMIAFFQLDFAIYGTPT